MVLKIQQLSQLTIESFREYVFRIIFSMFMKHTNVSYTRRLHL